MRFTREGLLTAVLVVAALFVGSFVTDRLPKPDSVLGETPFLHEAIIGEQVALRTADVTVTEVRSAKQVVLHGQVSESAGVWLVADIVWEPRHEPSLLGGTLPVVVSTDGRTFGGTQAVINNCGPTQPGLPVTCQLPFEMPVDALEGARLRIPAATTVRGSDDVADIDLAIDAEMAQQLAATDEQLALATTTAVGR
ncbi:MAG: hypothetical protein R2722_08550 [Tessaracoccus sp.]